MKVVVVRCTHCGNDVSFEVKYLGKNVLCPYCQKLFVPPYQHSGYGIAAFWLGITGILFEAGAITYTALDPDWALVFLSARNIKMLLRFVGLLGVVLSWIGIGCAVAGYKQKRRRKFFCKWGLILCLLPTLMCVGYAGVNALLPEPTEETQEEMSEEARGPRYSPAVGQQPVFAALLGHEQGPRDQAAGKTSNRGTTVNEQQHNTCRPLVEEGLVFLLALQNTINISFVVDHSFSSYVLAGYSVRQARLGVDRSCCRDRFVRHHTLHPL
ncbi:MAG: hypothetical protein KatS3mg105_2574 [Gemmatales bacterium]|nr:MAG: hypothetical protein KatS3mg105_2574 [Gemmatales bacterium]